MNQEIKNSKENTTPSNQNKNPNQNNIKTEINPLISVIKKSKTEMQSNINPKYISINEDLDNESKYSIELIEEEEDEINSDDYISSTMLDVETNTYIDYSMNNNNEKNTPKKSNTKNFKNFVKAININNKDYLNQNRKNEKSNSKSKNKNNKNDIIIIKIKKIN